MEFKDIFREKYRKALYAARDNNKELTIGALRDLCLTLNNQFNAKNADSIVTKAKLSYWYDNFNKYIVIIQKYGLSDLRVQKLFGLIDDSVKAPSFNDVMNGKVELDTEKPFINDDIKIDGLKPKDTNDDNDNNDNLNDAVSIESITPIEDSSIDSIDEVDDGNIDIENIDKKPIFEPLYTPSSLDTFIGQQHIVKVLKKEIAIAKNEGRKHLDNILLFGNPGLGKTTLMELIAKELGVRFELLDCSQFRNSQQSLKALQNFFMRVARENEPVVIALDEVHMLNNELQSSLLTLLNSRVYVSPLDVNGNCKRIPIDEFTFIAATTDDDKVLDTIKNRCLRLKFQMVDYTYDELKQIYKNKIASKGLTATDEAIDICIPRSRGAIRYVNSIVEGLNSALYDDEGRRMSTHIDLDVALKYFNEKGIDSIGLEKKDLEILNEILNDNTGTISADVLAARVGLETKKYLSEYEKYLIKIGFINVTGRGRSLSEKAINYLKGDENEG